MSDGKTLENSTPLLGLHPPKPLVVNTENMANIWKLWKQQFEFYATATQISTKPGNTQLSILMSVIGSDALVIYNTFEFSASEERDLQTVVKKFDDYFIPKVNVTFESGLNSVAVHKFQQSSCWWSGFSSILGSKEMAPKLEHVTFFNGRKMPIVGLGTWQSSKGEVGHAVDVALEAGYRHIDTAYVYGNEAEIGQALKKWFDSGKLKREDLFIVTKLPPVGNRAESVEKYIRKSLEALQLSYVDLYLVHHPVGFQDVGGETFPRDKDGRVLLDVNTDLLSLWKAMEAQVDAGRARSIGLSNFSSSQIKRIWQAARIKPANLQVELHVYFQQRELAAFCKALDVTVCAYAPLGSPQMANLVRSRGGDVSKIVSLSPMSDSVVTRIAEKHKKTTAQVLLRHIMQRGIVVIPKSVNPDRIKQNFDVFDFELTPEDMDELDALDKGAKGRMFNDVIAPERAQHPEYPYHERY